MPQGQRRPQKPKSQHIRLVGHNRHKGTIGLRCYLAPKLKRNCDEGSPCLTPLPNLILFDLEFAVLLLDYISLSFEFRSSETYGCETRGIHMLHTYTRTDQWIFRHFLASGDHNFRFYYI